MALAALTVSSAACGPQTCKRLYTDCPLTEQCSNEGVCVPRTAPVDQNTGGTLVVTTGEGEGEAPPNGACGAVRARGAPLQVTLRTDTHTSDNQTCSAGTSHTARLLWTAPAEGSYTVFMVQAPDHTRVRQFRTGDGCEDRNAIDCDTDFSDNTFLVTTFTPEIANSIDFSTPDSESTIELTISKNQ